MVPVGDPEGSRAFSPTSHRQPRLYGKSPRFKFMWTRKQSRTKCGTFSPGGKCSLAVTVVYPPSAPRSPGSAVALPWPQSSQLVASLQPHNSLKCGQAGYGRLGSARWIRKLNEAPMHPSTLPNRARGFTTHTVHLALLVLSTLKYCWFPCDYSGPPCFLGLFPSPCHLSRSPFYTQSAHNGSIFFSVPIPAMFSFSPTEEHSFPLLLFD